MAVVTVCFEVFAVFWTVMRVHMMNWNRKPSPIYIYMII